MKTTLRLQGLDCASCAIELEELILKNSGVTSANVSFIEQKAWIEYTDERALQAVKRTINGFENVRVVEAQQDEAENKREWWVFCLSAILLVAGLLVYQYMPVFGYVCYATAYILVALPVFVTTVKNVSRGRLFDENFLMVIASIGAIFLGEYFESVAVMLLYRIGEALQTVATRASRGSLNELMALKSDKTDVLRMENGKTVYQSLVPERIIVGDKLLIKKGERVPVDGVLLSNNAQADTKALTGESELRHLQKGDEVLSGFVNTGAVFQMQATRLYEDSAVGRILDMVENATAGKAKPEKFITKFARVYTPIVCLCAVVLAVIAPFLNGVANGTGFAFVNGARWLRSALTFLVVSCPCALVISVPLTYFIGIGACAKRGILVKGSTYLDILAQTQTFAFDKTGTLTEGNFEICNIYPNGVTAEELTGLAGALETYSAHPIAQAFPKNTEYTFTDMQEFSGRGICGMLNGEKVLVGNAKLLSENGVPFALRDSTYTLVYVARGNTYLGAVEIGDKTREGADTVLRELQANGVKRTVMLTGDTKARAKRIADEVGVSEWYAELLPDEKVHKAQALQKTGTLTYVGDGINDAPVMAVADCAVSMGKLGSATAVEVSNLVLISDDLSALPKALRTAKKTRKVALQNIVFSIAMKTAFMVLGAFGVLPLFGAVFADVGVMLLAVANAFRVKK